MVMNNDDATTLLIFRNAETLDPMSSNSMATQHCNSNDDSNQQTEHLFVRSKSNSLATKVKSVLSFGNSSNKQNISKIGSNSSSKTRFVERSTSETMSEMGGVLDPFEVMTTCKKSYSFPFEVTPSPRRGDTTKHFSSSNTTYLDSLEMETSMPEVGVVLDPFQVMTPCKKQFSSVPFEVTSSSPRQGDTTTARHAASTNSVAHMDSLVMEKQPDSTYKTSTSFVFNPFDVSLENSIMFESCSIDVGTPLQDWSLSLPLLDHSDATTNHHHHITHNNNFVDDIAASPILQLSLGPIATFEVTTFEDNFPSMISGVGSSDQPPTINTLRSSDATSVGAIDVINKKGRNSVLSTISSSTKVDNVDVITKKVVASAIATCTGSSPFNMKLDISDIVMDISSPKILDIAAAFETNNRSATASANGDQSPTTNNYRDNNDTSTSGSNKSNISSILRSNAHTSTVTTSHSAANNNYKGVFIHFHQESKKQERRVKFRETASIRLLYQDDKKQKSNNNINSGTFDGIKSTLQQFLRAITYCADGSPTKQSGTSFDTTIEEEDANELSFQEAIGFEINLNDTTKKETPKLALSPNSTALLAKALHVKADDTHRIVNCSDHHHQTDDKILPAGVSPVIKSDSVESVDSVQEHSHFDYDNTYNSLNELMGGFHAASSTASSNHREIRLQGKKNHSIKKLTDLFDVCRSPQGEDDDFYVPDQQQRTTKSHDDVSVSYTTSKSSKGSGGHKIHSKTKKSYNEVNMDDGSRTSTTPDQGKQPKEEVIISSKNSKLTTTGRARKKKSTKQDYCYNEDGFSTPDHGKMTTPDKVMVSIPNSKSTKSSAKDKIRHRKQSFGSMMDGCSYPLHSESDDDTNEQHLYKTVNNQVMDDDGFHTFDQHKIHELDVPNTLQSTNESGNGKRWQLGKEAFGAVMDACRSPTEYITDENSESSSTTYRSVNEPPLIVNIPDFNELSVIHEDNDHLRYSQILYDLEEGSISVHESQALPRSRRYRGKSLRDKKSKSSQTSCSSVVSNDSNSNSTLSTKASSCIWAESSNTAKLNSSQGEKMLAIESANFAQTPSFINSQKHSHIEKLNNLGKENFDIKSEPGHVNTNRMTIGIRPLLQLHLDSSGVKTTHTKTGLKVEKDHQRPAIINTSSSYNTKKPRMRAQVHIILEQRRFYKIRRTKSDSNMTSGSFNGSKSLQCKDNEKPVHETVRRSGERCIEVKVEAIQEEEAKGASKSSQGITDDLHLVANWSGKAITDSSDFRETAAQTKLDENGLSFNTLQEFEPSNRTNSYNNGVKQLKASESTILTSTGNLNQDCDLKLTTDTTHDIVRTKSGSRWMVKLKSTKDITMNDHVRTKKDTQSQVPEYTEVCQESDEKLKSNSSGRKSVEAKTLPLNSNLPASLTKNTVHDIVRTKSGSGWVTDTSSKQVLVNVCSWKSDENFLPRHHERKLHENVSHYRRHSSDTEETQSVVSNTKTLLHSNVYHSTVQSNMHRGMEPTSSVLSKMMAAVRPPTTAEDYSDSNIDGANQASDIAAKWKSKKTTTIDITEDALKSGAAEKKKVCSSKIAERIAVFERNVL